MTLGNDWFTEIHADGGSAFSLKITRKLHEEQSAFQRIEVFATEDYGNLMTLPLGGGLLYVLPIYTERKVGEAGYPALQFVAVRFGEHVGIGSTLQEALDMVFGGDAGANTNETETKDPPAKKPPTSENEAQVTKLLNESDAAFKAAEAALKAGGAHNTMNQFAA